MIALLIIFLTFGVGVVYKPFRDDARLRQSFWLSLVLHHLTAFVNAEVTVLPGAEGDSEGFYAAAAATSGVSNYDKLYYTHLLRYSFSFFGPSRLLAAELSVLAFTLCCVLLVEVLRELQCERAAAGAVLLFGCMPSVIFHFSIPLRESFQCAALTAVVLSSTRLRKRLSLHWMIVGGVSLLVLSASHLHLSAMAIGVATLSILFVSKRFVSGRAFFFLGILASLLLVFYGAMLGIRPEKTVASGVASVQTYRDGVLYEKARANYGGQIDTSSILSLIVSCLRLYWLYMLAPYPWLVGTIPDIFALLEDLLRLALLFKGIRIWMTMEKGPNRDLRGYIIAVFILVEFYWSLGTGNWGTAYRHHTVAVALLPILAAALGPGVATGASPTGTLSLREQVRRSRRLSRSTGIPPLASS